MSRIRRRPVNSLSVCAQDHYRTVVTHEVVSGIESGAISAIETSKVVIPCSNKASTDASHPSEELAQAPPPSATRQPRLLVDRLGTAWRRSNASEKGTNNVALTAETLQSFGARRVSLSGIGGELR